jgi:hypothetical protein
VAQAEPQARDGGLGRAQRRQEHVREQETEGQDIPERHRDREDDRDPGREGPSRPGGVKGRWRWVEYELAGARYTELGVPASVCTGCHVGAKSTDWVFTKR